MGWLKRFSSLPFATKRLLAESLLRLAAASAAVHLMPGSAGRKHWTGALTARVRRSPKHNTQDPATTSWAVVAASRFVPGATCLVQAIVGERLLMRSGFPAQVKIGVTRDDNGALAAHAWLVLDGQVLIGRDARVYSEMPLPSADATSPDRG